MLTPVFWFYVGSIYGLIWQTPIINHPRNSNFWCAVLKKNLQMLTVYGSQGFPLDMIIYYHYDPIFASPIPSDSQWIPMLIHHQPCQSRHEATFKFHGEGSVQAFAAGDLGMYLGISDDFITWHMFVMLLGTCWNYEITMKQDVHVKHHP